MQHSKNEDIYLIISNNIKKYRLRKHISQRELATKCGYSYTYIRQIEAKKCTKKYSIQVIYNISIVLEINIVKLFEKENI